MGVPKFFRWISERYPCLSQLVREHQIPEFDNLYLDMNGIIHMCSHPNDFDPHFRITEEKMFQDIFHYVEVLFCMIKPKRLFFLAVDGVAPRAKMNQQRGRRFRSAKEAEILEQKAQEQGEQLPTESRFDSNCITPGTVFMARLHEQLKYFVTYKVSTDRQWQKIKVILSGHETPGEGEHKIMDYIRYMKSQPGYDPNTRHCLYGLDADLIMLGLCLHEPHFSLLREEVKYRRTKPPSPQQQLLQRMRQQQHTTTPEEMRFFLLHLSLMREYLKLEFQQLEYNDSFEFDIEKIIDDWVLMCFLVGNDFIPPLPDMHITTGALPTLYQAYIEIFPTLGGYINEAGTLNLKRFKKYMEKLSAFDVDKFRDMYADIRHIRYIETKPEQQCGSLNEKKTGGKGSLLGEAMPLKNPELEALIQMTNAEFEGCEDEDDQELGISSEEDFDTDDEDIFYTHFKQHKRDYYMNKMEYAIVDREVLRSQADGYVQAIQWNLHYYYNGVCSWSWFYPHHYAPYISDICNFSEDLELHFDLGAPFLPFQQLLAVLPAGSKNLLPKPYQELMVNETSPILHFYPSEFRTDLNGKKHEWEAVVLIPFIDEKSLLAAMEPYALLLSPEEKKRNSHGPMVIYTFTEEDLGVYEAPEYFPPLHHNHAAKLEMLRDELNVAQSCLVKGLCPGVRLDVYFPGFPTLNYIPFTASLRRMRVKVFEHCSQGNNMTLQIDDQEKPDIKEVAKDLLGQIIYVSWPHLAEARVIAVSNRDFQYGVMSGSAIQQTIDIKANSPALWNAQCSGIKEHYLERRGVDIGDTNILVTAVLLVGRKYIFSSSGKITLEKQWSELPTQYALQTIVRDIAVQEQRFAEYKTIQEIFPPQAVCFMLGHPHYGAMGEVLESGGEIKCGRIKVNMKVTPEPHLGDIQKQHQDSIIQYMSANQAAQHLGISSHLVSRVTGTIYVALGDKNEGYDFCPKVNVGLNLKFSKRNEEVPGFSRKDGTMWQYSIKAVELLRNYLAKFPEVLNYLAHHTGNDIFYATEIFPKNECDEAISKVNEVADWLRDQPQNRVKRNLCGTEVVDTEVVQALEHVVDEFHVQLGGRLKTVIMQVKPHLLFRPSLHIGNMAPDGSATHKLFDRIVNVRECFTVPLGLKGTIIGMCRTEREGDMMYHVLFDKPFPGGLVIGSSAMREYRVPGSSFLNLSHGQRTEQMKTGNKPTAVVNPSENGGIHHRCIYLPRNSYPPSAFAPWNNNAQQPIRSTSYVSSTNTTSGNFRNMPQSFHRNENMVQPQFMVSSFSPQQQSGSGGRKPRYQQNIVPTKPQVLPSQSNSAVQPNKNISEPASSNEFQALWVSLQKASENVPLETKQNDGLDPQLAPTNESEEIPDRSGTELLKKMLRIPDRVTPEPLQPHQSSPVTVLTSKKQTSSQMQVEHNPELPPQTPQQQLTPQLQSINKVSVEEIFKHAKNTEPTPVKKDGQGYCMQLLQLFQIKGLGIPRYDYVTNIDDGSMTARVILPDLRSYTGNRAFTREEASENAARLAFGQISRDSFQCNPYSHRTHHSQNGSVANKGFMAGKPGTNKLPVPPQQWYNQQQFRGYRFNRQGDWWRGADIVQQQYSCQRQSPHRDLSTGGRSQQYTGYSRVSPNQFRQGPTNTGNWRQQPQQRQYQHHLQHRPTQLLEQEQQLQQSSQMKRQVRRPSVEELQCQFVPLQAVKQQRNKAVGGALSSPQQAQEVEITQQIQQNLSVSECKHTINKENQSVQAASNSMALKPLVVRPRKCRLAANFNLKPATEQ